jgi:hypothetical protein
VAISDKRGTLYIENDEVDHIGNTVMLEGAGIPVPAFTIDGLVEAEGIKRVALLKMNIEGAERLAVQSMSATRDIAYYVAISCHDFIADRVGSSADALRTRDEIIGLFKDWGWEISRRENDPRPWVRDYVYAKNPDCHS